MKIYVVKPGDTVDAIAAETGMDVSFLIEVNQIPYPYRLAVGQALLLFSDKDRPGDGGGGLVRAGGYAYPFMSSQTLSQTLPFLGELLVFSYGFTEEGILLSPKASDDWMVSAALDGGVKPILTLTPMGADGRFDSGIASELFRHAGAKRALLSSLIGKLAEKGYQGVNFDFEYVLSEDKNAYTEFVGLAKSVLSPLDYEVSVALPPKTSDDQPGLLYEGMDYRGLSQAADWVLLMTYEWGYTYGPPMAVAPISQVRRVVEYALSRIPPEKVSLGIPNYGYDWPLPFERGVTSARTIGNTEAVRQAIFYGVPIRFDRRAQSPFYRYWQYGVEHEVWFEDVRM